MTSTEHITRDGLIRLDPYAGADDGTSLSAARTQMWDAQRAVQDAQNELATLTEWLTGRDNGIYCDHPETAGWACDVCHGFVPLSDAVIEWIDTDNVRMADAAEIADIVTAAHASAYLLMVRRRQMLTWAN